MEFLKSMPLAVKKPQEAEITCHVTLQAQLRLRMDLAVQSPCQQLLGEVAPGLLSQLRNLEIEDVNKVHLVLDHLL
jgi:hypothetical protein